LRDAGVSKGVVRAHIRVANAKFVYIQRVIERSRSGCNTAANIGLMFMRILGMAIAAVSFTIVSATLVAAQTPVTPLTPLPRQPLGQASPPPGHTPAPTPSPGLTLRITTKPLSANFYH
jgi:hypothetical protein